MVAFQPYLTQNFVATAQIGPLCGGEKRPFARRLTIGSRSEVAVPTFPSTTSLATRIRYWQE